MSFRNEQILAVKHYEYGATGSGNSSSDPASPVDGDIMPILAGTVIIGADCIIKSAVTGSIDVGDDDDADGFIATGAVTEATPGIYVGAGAYCSAITVRKYYGSAGKEVKLDATTISAGSFAIVVYGYRV
jgi:hypothetical protein